MNHKLQDDFTPLHRNGGGPAEVDLEANHEIVIALVQLNVDQLEGFVHEVSNPSLATYGQYMSREDVANLTFNAVAIEAVRKYLQSNGIVDYTETLHGEYVTARAPLRKWEMLFIAKFQAFQHRQSGRIVHRSSSYTLPADLSNHVVAVYHILELPAIGMRTASKMESTDESPQFYTTPTTLIHDYNIFTNLGNGPTSQAIFITNSSLYFSSSDLATFLRQHGAAAHPVDQDEGHRDAPKTCVNNPSLCQEANLDLEYMLSIAQDIATTVM